MDEDGLVDKIYEAAVHPARWQEVLQAFARVADAKDAALITARGTQFSRWLTSSPEFEEIIELHAKRYAANLRTRRLIGTMHPGFLQDRDVLTQDEIDQEPVYHELLIPRGYGSGVATAIFASGGDTLILHAEYGHSRGLQRAGLIAKLDRLRPHFARAALLSSRLDMERARAMTEALKVVALPGAVLRANGRVYVANFHFHALFHTLFDQRHDRLTLVNEAADRRFSTALNRISLARTAAGASAIAIAAADGRLPYILHLLPLKGAAGDIFTQAMAVLIVTPVDRAAVPSVDVLQGLFDLTPAEARVARGIGEAQTVEDLAEALGVSRETVRTQLKSVLAKSGAGRQAELVRLLAGLSQIV